MSFEREVRFISAELTIPLRKKVLKPHLRPDECLLPEDFLKTTFHLGAFFCGNLVTVATFILESHQELPAGHPYRLRGMATDQKYWDQGFGALVLQEGTAHLKQIRSDLLWCNARLRAFAFYEKLGFKYWGEMFEIKDIGPHKVMYKHLIPR